MKRAAYICIEGVEGVGKTTQTDKLVDTLTNMGFKVLKTKEPGSPLIPITVELRKIMLDNQYDSVLTKKAREYLSQAIRSIHLEKLIIPSLYEYDFIVQDRGILSGYAYGMSCGNSFNDLYSMACQIVDEADGGQGIFSVLPEHIYDKVIYLQGDSIKGLEKARQSKQEFVTGDAMESRGNSFVVQTSHNMDMLALRFNTVTINIDNKSIEEVHSLILSAIGLEK